MPNPARTSAVRMTSRRKTRGMQTSRSTLMGSGLWWVAILSNALRADRLAHFTRRTRDEPLSLRIGRGGKPNPVIAADARRPAAFAPVEQPSSALRDVWPQGVVVNRLDGRRLDRRRCDSFGDDRCRALIWLDGSRPHDGFIDLEVGLERRAKLIVDASQLPQRPRQHPPDLGQPFRPNHEERDHQDEKDLLQAAAHFKHREWLRSLERRARRRLPSHTEGNGSSRRRESLRTTDTPWASPDRSSPELRSRRAPS